MIDKNLGTTLTAWFDLRGQVWVKMMKKSIFFYSIISLSISSKICSHKSFFEIRFRFLLRIKNVKQKKSNFSENFVFISKICRTLFNVEYNDQTADFYAKTYN